MIHLTIASVRCFFSKPFKGLEGDVLVAVKEAAPNRVVFLDTPPMAGLVTAIGQVTDTLPDAKVVVRDHHDVPDPTSDRDRQIHAAAEKVRNLLGDAARISDRASHPACSGLVEVGEFNDGSTVVIADNDADGLTASMKAVGVTYPQLDTDAAILDGPHSEQNAEGGLSELGCLLVKGLATLPPYNPQRPQPALKAKESLFGDFVACVQGNGEARSRLESRVADYEAAVQAAESAAKTVEEVAPGVLLVDIREVPKVHLGTLSSRLEARQGCRVTVVIKGAGPIAAAHGGVQYSLARARALKDEDLDLRDYLPEGFVSDPQTGVIANTTFLAHVSEDVWTREVLPRLKGEK